MRERLLRRGVGGGSVKVISCFYQGDITPLTLNCQEEAGNEREEKRKREGERERMEEREGEK